MQNKTLIEDPVLRFLDLLRKDDLNEAEGLINKLIDEQKKDNKPGIGYYYVLKSELIEKKESGQSAIDYLKNKLNKIDKEDYRSIYLINFELAKLLYKNFPNNEDNLTQAHIYIKDAKLYYNGFRISNNLSMFNSVDALVTSIDNITNLKISIEQQLNNLSLLKKIDNTRKDLKERIRQLNDKADRERLKQLEVISIFSAIIAIIVTSFNSYNKPFSFKDIVAVNLSLVFILSIFILLIDLVIKRGDQVKDLKDLRIYFLIFIVGLFFIITLF